MPLWDHYAKLMKKSPSADLNNISLTPGKAIIDGNKGRQQSFEIVKRFSNFSSSKTSVLKALTKKRFKSTYRKKIKKHLQKKRGYYLKNDG